MRKFLAWQCVFWASVLLSVASTLDDDTVGEWFVPLAKKIVRDHANT